MGKILLEKREIRRECQEKENKIKEGWQYIHANAGQLILSELSAVFLPGRKSRDENEGGGGLLNSPWMNMAWQIAKPIAYHWMGEVGWQVFKSMFRKKRG